MRIAIVIAAGGQGRRMGGAKPERLLADRRLIDHAVARAGAMAAPTGAPVALAAPHRMPGIDLPLLPDAAPGLGPVAALASGMAFAEGAGCAAVLLMGCDQPFLPADLPARLADALAAAGPGHGAALPEAADRLQPLAGLWRCDAGRLAGWMASGGRALMDFARHQGLVRVVWPTGAGPCPFTNLNHPADLAAAERHLRAAAP